MRLKLMVDGDDQRIRITPAQMNKAEQKLLEYIKEWDIARIYINKETYGNDIKSLDLVLENEVDERDDGTVGVKEMLYPQA